MLYLQSLNNKKFYQFNHFLLFIHLVISVVLVYFIIIDDNDYDRNIMVLPAVILYFYAIVILISKLKKLQDLVTPIGIVSLFFYITFYIKFLILHYDKTFFFPSWIYTDAPLYFADHEWGDAFVLFTCAYLLFVFSYRLVCGKYLGVFDAIQKIYECGEYVSALILQGISRHFLVFGLIILILRYITTHLLGLGQSIGNEAQLLNIPYIGGVLQLFTLWGGRLILATALTLALTTKSRKYIFIATSENILYGIISMVNTGSKAELFVPVMIVMTIFIIYRDRIEPFIKKGILLGSFLFFAIGVAIYPAFHNYRYVKSEISAVEYLSSNRKDINVFTGISEIIGRLTGLEGLTNILSYQNRSGDLPGLSLNYQPYIVYQLFGISKNITMGIGVGLIGGAYLLGGTLGLVIFSWVLGIACGKLYHIQNVSNIYFDIQIAFITVSYFILLNILLFSGNILFDAKQITIFLFIFYLIKKYVSTKYSNFNVVTL